MQIELQSQFDTRVARPVIDVSIVMPCLNEELSLPHCLANAREALDLIEAELGLSGEIVVADNGSTDRSIAIATAAGARVVPVTTPGYGAALIGGAKGAAGRFIVMGDADGSYDFRESVAMVAKLAGGADLCMGSRFKGGIARGAMPWKNRYIGNPVLTGILNLMYRAGVSDAHCGLRAITAEAFHRLALCGTGMEFASEMVIKAALKKLHIAEVPATLSPDLRERAPHLRPWRDGWRHLRYLMMLSPAWLFAMPSLVALLLGFSIFGAATYQLLVSWPNVHFGASWTILAGALIGIGHIGLILAAATHLYGVRQGYRPLLSIGRTVGKLASLENMLLAGLVEGLAGGALLSAVMVHWSRGGFVQLASVLPVVGGTVLLVVGAQTFLGGFLLAIISGHEARFLSRALIAEPPLTDAIEQTLLAA